MIFIRNRRFGLLWTSTLLSNLGNWLMIVAVPVYVYTMTGSTLSSGFAFVAQTLPAIVFAPLAGVVADRWDRRTVMVGADLLRMVIVLALLVVDDPGMLWLLYTAMFFESAIGHFFQPAARAVVPAIVGRGGDLEAANAWNTVAGGIVRLAGAPLGGALYALVGFDGLVLIDSATYLLSAVLIFGMGRLRVADNGRQPDTSSWLAAFWEQVREGLAFLFRHSVLRATLIVSSLFLSANAALNVLLVPYVLDVLGGDAGDVGVLMAALGGGFLASAYVGNVLSRSGLLRLSFTGCLAAITLCFAGLFLIHHFVAALVFIALAGLPGGALLMLVQVQVQRQTPDRQLGRVGSAFSAAEMAATVVGASAGSIAGQQLPLTTTVWLVIGVLAASAVLAAALLPTRPGPAAAKPEATAEPAMAKTGDNG
ncbi:Predicted arabinose efflux permease, MFS family [Micromonospora echinofusca]|uniref:Predicted arabinose efflux permease, MFS family n=1 Tax=Micromonospora echinofusca TaxID=47858 RepID=A0A1C5GAZ5_MICEH|nr:MFS transporter [Micromonospora echinofusca]SCG16900.1 Predicted arabinose efflux permease, MFS family [Micromonospora echinofusca]